MQAPDQPRRRTCGSESYEMCRLAMVFVVRHAARGLASSPPRDQQLPHIVYTGGLPVTLTSRSFACPSSYTIVVTDAGLISKRCQSSSGVAVTCRTAARITSAWLTAAI